MPWFRWDGEDLVLQVRIQPRARRDEFAGVVGDCLKVRITAPPLEGRANAQLIAFVARQFGTAKGHVSLLQGETARTKVVRVEAPTRIPPGLAIRLPRA
ncbi:MAG: DUF167 family protein [Acidiferrobacterales bacterium]